METHDTRFTGDVQSHATKYSTVDYKIEYACGVGNKSGKVVFMGMLKSNSSRDNLIQTGSTYTTIQEAVLSMVSPMNEAQKNLTKFFADQFDEYMAE